MYLKNCDGPHISAFGGHACFCLLWCTCNYGIRHKIILRTDPLITANTLNGMRRELPRTWYVYYIKPG